MSEIRILGVGSPFGDDRLGWEAADFLETALVRRHRQISIERCDRPGAELLQLMKNARAVIVIDAMKGGCKPGTIKRIEPTLLYRSFGLSNHSFGVAEALELAQVLGELPEELVIFGIEAGTTPSVNPAPDWNQLLQLVLREIERLVHSDPCLDES